MVTNCDECPCRTETKCNLGYTIHAEDIGGGFIPASENCKLIKIVTEEYGDIFPDRFENE